MSSTRELETALGDAFHHQGVFDHVDHILQKDTFNLVPFPLTHSKNI